MDSRGDRKYTMDEAPTSIFTRNGVAEHMIESIAQRNTP
jgi:hypothetical protein